MSRHLRFLAAFAFFGLATSATPLVAQSGAPAPSTARPALAQLLPDSLERARRYAIWLFTARKDSLFASLDSAVAIQFGGSEDAMDEMTAELAIRVGSEERVLEERWVNRLGKRQYWRTSKYTNASEPFMLRVVMLPNGKIAGIGFNPLSQAPPTDP
jgi:hypothetical protein